MSYDFRILGPVGWERDGEVVSPGPPKRRAVLAALLLEANRPVPVARLAGAVWPGAPPRSAAVNLRGHLSQLRRAAGRRLRFHPGGYGGYELRVEDAELDAAQFTMLATAGRAALAGRPAVALVRLGRALGLWRGTAGDGLPRGTWLDARFEDLDQQRLEVFEDHVTARLHTREFPEIAADLRRHLISWPIRERCWELLMLTHYRCGDPPAALAAYRQARAVLVEQLGVEPGPKLQRLHQAVLRGDQSLDGPPAPRQAVTLTDPDPAGGAQRRAPPQPPVVGRADERWALAAALREHPPAVVVCGPAGVGKSALAAAAITTVADAFPDGQMTIELASGNAPALAATADLPHRVGQALDDSLPEPAPHTVTEQATRYHARVGRRRMLVVLDGATNAAQVRPLLSDSGPTVLVTSRRRRLELPQAWHLEVDRLAGRQALDLLTWYAGAVRTGDQPAAVRELVRICDGLPLALRIVGEWLARRPGLPAGLLAAHLARRPLDGLRAGNLSVRDALAADLQTVADHDPHATRVFPLLADGHAHPPEALAAELGQDTSLVFFTLERLVDQWLVNSPEPGRYRTTGLPRAYAAELARAG